jgi:predicted HTH transcriptional regulator
VAEPHRRQRNSLRLGASPTFREEGMIFVSDLPLVSVKVQSQSGKGSGKTSLEMSGKILELLSDNPQLTLTEAATRLDVSTRTVERHVATLKQQNRLTRAGSRKDGRWEVVE